MAGQGLYLVGPNQAFKQVNDAVKTLSKDQGNTPFTNQQEIRIVEEGGYKPFEVSGVRPGAAGLVIGGAPGIEVVIDGALDPKANVGAAVGHHVTYTHLKNLRFRGTKYGVHFGHYANNGIVEAVRCYDHTDWGVYSWRCDQMTVVDSEFAGCRISIGMHQNRGSFIAHNSIYSKPMSGPVSCGILVSHLGDMREDENIFANAIFADGTACLWFESEDVKDVISDYNCLYAPGGALVRVFHHAKTTPTRVIPSSYDSYKTLKEWQDFSGQDKRSISAPPGFTKVKPDENGSAVSLEPTVVSPLIAKGTVLSGLTVRRTYTEIGTLIEETSSAIPSWASASHLTTDINGYTRSTTPTIGAYERSVQQQDPGNDDPTTQPDDTDPDTGVDAGAPLECGQRASIIDRSVLQMATHVPCWHPEVHRGHFWVRDMPYYLYAEKRGLTLGDITFSEFDLDVDVLETGLSVSVGTIPVPAGNWDLHGPRLRVHHQGLELDHLGESVILEGQFLHWDSGTDSLQQRDIRYELQLMHGRTRHLLPDDVMDAGPVILTDDTIHPMNERTHLPGQFQLGAQVGGWGRELVLRNPNLLRNSAFHYQTASLPDSWEYDTGVTAPTVTGIVTQTGQYDIYPVHGDYFMQLESDQALSQFVPVRATDSHILSFYVSALEGISGTYSVQVDQYDHLRRLILAGSTLLSGTIFPDTGVASPDPWTRRTVQLPTLDTGAGYVDVILQGSGLCLDAAQLEIGTTATQYAHIPRGADMTVEYETSDKRFYCICDLDLSPFRNRMNEGFLHISAVPARQFDDDAPQDATTVSDWRWAYGRTEVLPWAKAHGVNKWRRVREWDRDDTLDISREAAYGLRTRQPRVVLIDPSLPVARQSSRGVEIAAEVRNEADNPYAFEQIDLTIADEGGEFPGSLARREYGYFTHLGTEITPEANNRGEVVARFIPPWVEEVEYRGAVPTGVQGVAYVDVPYQVYKGHHGNPSLHDSFGNLVTVTGQAAIEVLMPRIEGDYSVYDLQTFPEFGSLKLEEAIDGDTGWGYPLGETRNSMMDDTEFFHNYDTNRIALRGSRGPIRATFTRRRMWTNRQFPRRIYMDDTILSGITGEMLLRYDAQLKLTVRADKPAGITRGSSTHRTIPVILQNPHRGDLD